MGMKNKTTKLTVIAIFLVILIVGYYAYLSNRTREQKEDATMTVVQNTLCRRLDIDYPPTPKEVIKYYNEILKCFYNEECTEEEIEALGNKARELYDEDLLAINDTEVYFINLKADIEDYKKNQRRITSAAVAASTNVDFYEKDGFEFARIMCGYNIMENSVNKPSGQVYLLRRDEEKHWKIYGWEPVEEYNQNLSE